MRRIPRIDSIEELAHFWDTHDLTDFEDELEEMEEPVFDAGAQTLMRVRLRRDQAKALARRAKAAGVARADLVREWIAEKLAAR
jgi:hypothetical protein